MREEKTFRVVVFRFETDASTNYTRYMIASVYKGILHKTTKYGLPTY